MAGRPRAGDGRLERTWTANNDTRYTHDKLGRLETVFVSKRNGVTPSGSERTVYAYDAIGNLNTVSLPNGVVSDYNLDPQKRGQKGRDAPVRARRASST